MSDAPIRQRELTDLDGDRSRSAPLAPATINAEARSVRSVIATEQPVMAFDTRARRAVLEILLVDGMEAPDRVPLIDTHNRSSVKTQFGSVSDYVTADGQITASLAFSSVAEREWTLASEGHLRDVSAGYQAIETTEIPAGQTRTIRGRQFTAPPTMPLWVTSRWRLTEVSLTVVGADAQTKIRTGLAQAEPDPSPSGRTVMKKKLRAYLESLGLAATATEAQAVEFQRSLAGEQRTRAAELESAADDTTTTTTAADATQAATGAEHTRAATTQTTATNVAVDPTLESRIRSEERARIERLRAVAGSDVPADVLQNAINTGLTEDQFAPVVLTHVRARSGAVSAGGGAAIHARSHDGDCNVAVLQAAMLLRSNFDLGRDWSRHRTQVAGRLPAWMLVSVNDDARQRAMDTAHRFRSMSLLDIARECVRLDGGRVTHDRDDMIRSAVSGASMSAIFTTNVAAELLGAYVEADDSTRGWVAEADVPNFLASERAAMGKFGPLKPLAKGSPADHLTTSDSVESSKIARYAGQFVLDEMDIINDRFGALEQVSPQEMGLSAAALRPDLIYSEIHANNSLDADSVALFHAYHGNLGAVAFGATGLQTAIQNMAKQRIQSRPLNLRPRYLVVPQDLVFTAQILLQSAMRYDASGTKNPLADLNLQIVSDDRMGFAGTTHPLTGTAYAGTATKYLLACRPGENGAKGLVVKYLRGTGRAPAIRSWVRTQGTWGIGWDINHDIGVDADDYRGLYMGNS